MELGILPADCRKALETGAENKNLAEDPYERLVNAIVLRAVTDYRVGLACKIAKWKMGI